MEEKKNEITGLKSSTAIGGMYENWFLDYASYVILERAVPALYDGLKPVQRRIMHAMREMDDGRFHKVANIIGQTMMYHPHGDAAIGDALVALGQKELLIETQGNWGDVRTGDSAAAPRYIEARLSAFAKEVVFNPEITEWQLAYDGRKKEPLQLPVKFPLVLAQGAEGIAVGLATKIMPHNFRELCKASIDVLNGKKTRILPDFPTGGTADFSQYNGGERGGRIRVRADIEVKDKRTLLVKSVPFGSTTSGLIDSIIKANDKGKVKIKRVTDNTAEFVEIEIELPPNTSPDLSIDALYAFTDCEVSISPNTCVILDDKPVFLNVNELLRISTEHTRELLGKELQIRKKQLEEKIFHSSLERIFIEERIYRDIEECETWPDVIATIDRGLEPFKAQLYREVTEEDIVRLTEIRIKRISKYDIFKADEAMRKLLEELAQVKEDLAHLTEYTIRYFQHLLEKYGKGKERKTVIKSFEDIDRTQVVAANAKLYVNRKEGFIGTGLKKDEFVSECSDIDDVIVFKEDGTMKVVRVGDKIFVGKNIIHIAVWQKGDERTTYNMIYRDSKKGISYVKRFAVKSITRDKDYVLTAGNDKDKVLYFTANPNGEAEIVNVYLSQGSRARKKVFEFDFAGIDIKGRGAKGNILTRYPVRKIELKEKGSSTIGGLKVWIDMHTGRLNTEERGKYLGEFDTGDSILAIYRDGTYVQTTADLVNRFDIENLLCIEKFREDSVVSTVYLDGERDKYFVKRFRIETRSLGQKFSFISEHKRSKPVLASLADCVRISYVEFKGKDKSGVRKELELSAFIDVKGWRAVGNQLGERSAVKKIRLEKEEYREKTTDRDRSGKTAEKTILSEKKEEMGRSEAVHGNNENSALVIDWELEKKDARNTLNRVKSGDVIEWEIESSGKETDTETGEDEAGQATLF